MARTDTATRTIASDRTSIYRAFLDPDALVRWLPPKGMTGRLERFDPRAGGGFRMALTYTDGAPGVGKTAPGQDVTETTIVGLIPQTRVVWRVQFDSADPAFGGAMTMTWSFDEIVGGTKVSVRADNVPEGVSAVDHAAGMASSLANLAAYVGG